MHLGPHHFQAQSRYFEDSIRFAVAAVWPYAWGLTACQIDTAALRNGTLAVLHVRGILPDGLAFNMPESDKLPPAREIGELFPPTRDAVTVFLAIPPYKPDKRNTALESENPTNGARFSSESLKLADETTGRDEKQIPLGRKNIRLLLDVEEPGDQITIPIARIQRAGMGQFI